MKKKIVFLPYDFDTAIGINNEGALVFSYNLEDIDQTDGGADVFNGQQSVLWKNMRAAFFDEMRAMYQNLRSTGKLSYEKVERMFEEHQEKWPEAIFNEDAWFKYLAPLVEKGNASYLSMLQGSKAEQRKWWLYNRFRYIDSKYNAGDALSDVITVRGYAKADITVEPYADVYATIKYGSYLVQSRSARNTKTTLPCPLDNVNDTEIYIYSASQLADVGDLSGLMVGYADFSKAVKLQALKIGDSDSGYSNGNLTELYLGNNELLRTLDVQNCPNLTQPVDLSGCANIEHIYFDGTAITGVDLPKGGILKTLHLPGTLANLSIIGHPGITDFVLPSKENLSTCRLENIGSGIDVKTMLGSLPAGCRTRVIGFAFSVSSESELTALKARLDTMRGLNENGGNEEQAQLLGTIQINSVTGATVKAFREKYPDVTINYKNISSICYFYNYDGTSVLRTATATNGGSVTYSGSTPTKPASESETYTFVGWSLVIGGQRDPSALLHIVEDRNVYPAFTASVRTFTVRFYVGTRCIETKSNVPYGTATEYTGATPPNTAESDPTDYEFTGWDKETTSVKSDLNVYAQFRYVGATYKHLIDGNLKGELYNELATVVGNRACYALASVTSISLPNVVTVEEYAFANSNPTGSSKGTSLLSVSLPNVKTIGQYAFSYQIKMTSLDVSAAETLKTRCFSHCEALQSIDLPKVTILPEYTFEADIKLESVNIPKVTRIEKYAFFYCNALTHITLPETLLVIGDSAFYRCFNLEEIIIPARVTSIASEAFRSCSKMARVIIKGQPSISNKAFQECTGLTDIYVPWSMTTTRGEPWGAPNAIVHYLEDGWMEELFPEGQEGE